MMEKLEEKREKKAYSASEASASLTSETSLASSTGVSSATGTSTFSPLVSSSFTSLFFLDHSGFAFPFAFCNLEIMSRTFSFLTVLRLLRKSALFAFFPDSAIFLNLLSYLETF
ncbi:hypothetical protein PFISCL1PPCAC_27451, partial [Pristionchus fissidentatus]